MLDTSLATVLEDDSMGAYYKEQNEVRRTNQQANASASEDVKKMRRFTRWSCRQK